MPILWVTGSNDFAYTLNALQPSYRLPRAPRTLCIRLRMPHGHGGAGENPEEIRVFADSILKGGAPLPRITRPGTRRDGPSGRGSSAKVPVVKAELNYTTRHRPLAGPQVGGDPGSHGRGRESRPACRREPASIT